MSVFNPAYNPVGYPTDAYGQPLPENPYAPFYSGPFVDQYVPRHWTPDPNQAFYALSISQGIPLGWCHPPALHADGNNPCINPRGYSTAPPNPTYLPPAHYYAYPIPTTAPVPPEPMDNYSPPRPPFATQTPPSPRQQRVEAYTQQCDKVLCFLCLSPAEFTRHTRTLLTNLGYSDASATLEVWADRLLDFYECYLQGNLPENTQGTLGIDDNLWNKLRALVKEIHTSPNPRPFEDPLDPARSFHQEELNAASSILRNLNPAGGLFDQSAAHTLALSTQPWASSMPSTFQTWDQPAAPELCSQRPPLCIDDDNWTLSYIDEPGNPTDEHASCNGPQRDRPPHFNLHAPHINAPLPRPNAPVPPQQPMGPGALQPPFSANPSCHPPALMPNPPTDTNYFGPLIPGGPPPPRWAPGPAPGSMGQNPSGGPPNGGPSEGWGPAMDNFPPQRRNRNHYYYYYNAGPPLRTQNSQDDTRNALAREGKLNIQKPEPFTSHNPQKWQIFLTQCLTMFQAKPITFQLKSSRVAFTTSYLQGIAFDHYTALLWFDPNNPVLSNWLAFTQEFSKAYETSWNYNALQFALCHALPQRIKDVLCLTHKQTTYDGYKVLVTQVNQHYWEDHSKNTAPQTSWNTSGNTNWQAGATNGIQSSIPANPASPTLRFPLGRGIPNTNRTLGQRPPTQLNATNLHDTPVPLDTNPDDHDDIPDPADNQEALCANRIQDSLWIDVPEEMQEK
ncbi:hypothetical protein E4T56_gene672 [Termitomyces sp. T112]|nr:hypothetical protein E4T56_gene672 [Termitomyces sp. T112]